MDVVISVYKCVDILYRPEVTGRISSFLILLQILVNILSTLKIRRKKKKVIQSEVTKNTNRSAYFYNDRYKLAERFMCISIDLFIRFSFKH